MAQSYMVTHGHLDLCQGRNQRREGRVRTREAQKTTNQCMGSEVKSVNAVANCIEVDAAKVIAPSKVDEKAPREVGMSGKGQMRV